MKTFGFGVLAIGAAAAARAKKTQVLRNIRKTLSFELMLEDCMSV